MVPGPPFLEVRVVSWSSWRETALNFRVLHWEGIPLHVGQRGLTWRILWVAPGSCACLESCSTSCPRATRAGTRHARPGVPPRAFRHSRARELELRRNGLGDWGTCGSNIVASRRLLTGSLPGRPLRLRVPLLPRHLAVRMLHGHVQAYAGLTAPAAAGEAARLLDLPHP